MVQERTILLNQFPLFLSLSSDLRSFPTERDKTRLQMPQTIVSNFLLLMSNQPFLTYTLLSFALSHSHYLHPHPSNYAVFILFPLSLLPSIFFPFFLRFPRSASFRFLSPLSKCGSDIKARINQTHCRSLDCSPLSHSHSLSVCLSLIFQRG